MKVSHGSNDVTATENPASAQESFVDVALETPKKSILMDETEMVYLYHSVHFKSIFQVPNRTKSK